MRTEKVCWKDRAEGKTHKAKGKKGGDQARNRLLLETNRGWDWWDVGGFKKRKEDEPEVSLKFLTKGG